MYLLSQAAITVVKNYLPYVTREAVFKPKYPVLVFKACGPRPKHPGCGFIITASPGFGIPKALRLVFVRKFSCTSADFHFSYYVQKYEGTKIISE